jgi:hypothetical protein
MDSGASEVDLTMHPSCAGMVGKLARKPIKRPRDRHAAGKAHELSRRMITGSPRRLVRARQAHRPAPCDGYRIPRSRRASSPGPGIRPLSFQPSQPGAFSPWTVSSSRCVVRVVRAELQKQHLKRERCAGDLLREPFRGGRVPRPFWSDLAPAIKEPRRIALSLNREI